jgi:shikimate kinase
MEKMVVMSPTKNIIVCGYLCSGKDTFSEQLALHVKIDIGDLVRKITSTVSRVQDKSLDDRIFEEFTNVITNTSGPFVVSGIRQVSLLKNIEQVLPNLEYIWLQVSQQERARRYKTRSATKDKDLSFEEAHQRDIELGINEVLIYLQTKVNFLTIKNEQ